MGITIVIQKLATRANFFVKNAVGYLLEENGNYFLLEDNSQIKLEG